MIKTTSIKSIIDRHFGGNVSRFARCLSLERTYVYKMLESGTCGGKTLQKLMTVTSQLGYDPCDIIDQADVDIGQALATTSRTIIMDDEERITLIGGHGNMVATKVEDQKDRQTWIIEAATGYDMIQLLAMAALKGGLNEDGTGGDRERGAADPQGLSNNDRPGRDGSDDVRGQGHGKEAEPYI